MGREVLITISGVQMTDGEGADVEMMVRGDYYRKDGKHYILYEEAMEGFAGTVKNIIKVSPGSLDIIKRGIASAHMQFEKDRKLISCYTTPMGEMVVGVLANRIEISEGEGTLTVDVDYSLDINYEHLSDCSIVVGVQSVDGAAL